MEKLIAIIEKMLEHGVFCKSAIEFNAFDPEFDCMEMEQEMIAALAEAKQDSTAVIASVRALVESCRAIAGLTDEDMAEAMREASRRGYDMNATPPVNVNITNGRPIEVDDGTSKE